MNSLLVVQRLKSDKQCVQGELLYRSIWDCFTLEPPFADDTVKPRAIPAGTYPLTIRYSAKHGRLVPHVENVPGFTEVEIHWGNYPKDTEACLLVGTMQGTDFVGHSVEAFNDLFLRIQEALAQGEQTITYIDPPASTNVTAADLDGAIGIG